MYTVIEKIVLNLISLRLSDRLFASEDKKTIAFARLRRLTYK